MGTTLVWFRNDLRLADNPALYKAAESGAQVVPIFIWSPEEERPWVPGGAHRWWLHESLLALQRELRAMGSDLLLRQGPSMGVLSAVLRESGADAVFWNQRIIPSLRRRDAEVEISLREEGIDVRTFAGRILHDPDVIKTGSGSAYRVFTPFWKNLRRNMVEAKPLARPAKIKAPDSWPSSDPINDLRPTPHAQDGVDWAERMSKFWRPGEKHAHLQLEAFIDEGLFDYQRNRNRPDLNGSSQLSPYLQHGELSPRQVWHVVNAWVRNASMRDAADAFLSEIGWREFAYHSIWHFPDLTERPLNSKFADFKWESDFEGLTHWQKGETGYPIVDAGMRQLWALGWMHNRVRMIVASFLTKHLMIPWQEGERWFWDTLVDGDLANNALNWQWVAGTGPDAQPFFRIFNPVLQGERFDPEGAYVREWVPELGKLPARYIHKPWEAPETTLDDAGVSLGETYPRPIVDHAQARERAMLAWGKIK